MTAPSVDVILARPGQSGLHKLNVFILELLESAGLGLLVAGGALWLGRITPDQFPRIVLGFLIGYLLLLGVSFVWQRSQVARIVLTWL